MSPSDTKASAFPDQKRSADEMDNTSSDEEKPDVSSYDPSPSPPARGKGKAKRSNNTRSPKKAKTTEANGHWSADARGTIVKYIFDRGTNGLNYAELSALVRRLPLSGK
ncbi:hypothetical protein A1Q2_05343 [Trichosporon asahii var. asahii CBS 8904]|uniref:Uncharacterized protein n=1 Tax=Trichosporon asahii var. asahii (strain CBS 8904) TaxID=1220162 RepID=K1WFM6_TRIAC|nr:hypothetical protein A1Q2_05343 [Trichosporon asahii var. asahii CBS 8904]